MENNEQMNLEDAFGALLGGGMENQAMDGDAQLLEVAEKHTFQVTNKQIKCLIYLDYIKEMYLTKPHEIQTIENIKQKFIQYTSRNNSQGFVANIIDFLSLRRYLGRDAIKVNVDKNT